MGQGLARELARAREPGRGRCSIRQRNTISEIMVMWSASMARVSFFNLDVEFHPNANFRAFWQGS